MGWLWWQSAQSCAVACTHCGRAWASVGPSGENSVSPPSTTNAPSTRKTVSERRPLIIQSGCSSGLAAMAFRSVARGRRTRPDIVAARASISLAVSGVHVPADPLRGRQEISRMRHREPVAVHAEIFRSALVTEGAVLTAFLLGHLRVL